MSDKLTKIQKAMRELGRMGGRANVAKHGNEHMRKIVQLRWQREKMKSNKIDAGRN